MHPEAGAGQTLGRYELTTFLGEGGMGTVYKAHDPRLHRDVAIKVMHAHFSRQGNFRERFTQEARTMAKLDHTGIVKVFDSGEERGLLYIVMEFIPGATLRQMLKDLRADGRWIILGEAVQLVRAVALAMDYVHRKGVLHRDLKPDNIMLKNEPGERLPYQPVITDLGLAKLSESLPITRVGESMGTPAYMSPEQAMDEPVDIRSEVYSLGILLFELAAGQLPFPAKTLSEARRYHTVQQPPPPSSLRPSLPAPLEQVILTCLQKKPPDRYPDTRALARALDEIMPGLEEAGSTPSEIQTDASLLPQYLQTITEEPGWREEEETQEQSLPEGDELQVVRPGETAYTLSIRSRQLTIGREPDNDIVLADSKVSRRHARIEFDGTNYRVVDLSSANGTYLAKAQLLPGRAEIWSPGQILLVGDTQLKLVRMGETRVDSDLIYESSEADRVAVTLETNRFSVSPGQNLSLALTVLNQSNVVEAFQVKVAGIAERWVVQPAPPLRLMPGGQERVSLVIQPPRSPESRAGVHSLDILIYGAEGQEPITLVETVLTVEPFYQFDVELRPQRGSGIAIGRFSLFVANQGNVDLALEWEAFDAQDSCQFIFLPPQPVVPPGEDFQIELLVQPRFSLLSDQPESHAFTVKARLAEAPELVRQLQGVWTQIPLAQEAAPYEPRQDLEQPGLSPPYPSKTERRWGSGCLVFGLGLFISLVASAVLTLLASDFLGGMSELAFLICFGVPFITGLVLSLRLARQVSGVSSSEPVQPAPIPPGIPKPERLPEEE